MHGLHLKKVEEENESKTLEELSNQTKSILKRTIEDSIQDDIIEDVMDTVSGKYKLNNSTIGRVMLMLKQSKNTQEFFENIATIKNDRKLKNVETLLKGKETKLQELPSVKCYQELISEKIDDEKYKLEYIKQILLQLKIEGGNQ